MHIGNQSLVQTHRQNRRALGNVAPQIGTHETQPLEKIKLRLKGLPNIGKQNLRTDNNGRPNLHIGKPEFLKILYHCPRILQGIGSDPGGSVRDDKRSGPGKIQAFHQEPTETIPHVSTFS